MITSSKPQRNPYVVGRPVDQQFLFGRETLFSSIKDDLEHNRNIILLHGQRRIGKSSVIRNICSQLSDLNEFVFVTFNLEYYSQESLSRILAELAKEIISDLSLDDENINLPEITELELEPEIFSHKFLPQVYQALKNKRLVFVIDEFDALLNSNNPELLKQVYQYYESLIINFRNKLFLILLIEQKSVNNPRISKIFKDVPIREIGLLDENNTKNLIIEPAKNILEYEEDAIKTIFNLSAGHPYLIQAICFTIFGRAREDDHWKIKKEDVEAIINKAIEISEAGLGWFWDGFSIPEKIVFAAIAEAQESSENYVALIKRFRPDTEDKQIIQTEQFLRSNGFLDEIEQKVKIELVRRWIIQRHPLREEISEFDKIEQKKNQSDIESHQNHVIIKDWVGENNSLNINLLNNSQKTFPVVTLSNRKLIILVAIATLSLIISSIGLVRYTQPCPVGEKKELGISCVVDNSRISRGDRTLFPSINNIPRDKGIQSFKKADYQQAAELFKKAVEANPNDPEVRIYYNNALTRQQGSPFTLAVVVPVGTNISDAQEILQGVAQAQDQFNQNKGLNGRLLEIVIGNDSNNSEEAKSVVQALIKDSSILGVIGHNSSEVTKNVLKSYETANLAIVSPTATSTELVNHVFFRVVDSDKISGQKLAQYAYNNLKFKKVVIFANSQSSYSKSISETFTQELTKLGGQVFPHSHSPFDFNKPYDKIEDSKNKYQAEAAMLFPDTEHTSDAIEIAKANLEFNKTNKNTPDKPILSLLGGHTLYSNDTLSNGGKAVEGMILSVPWFRDTPQTKPFAQKSDKIWGGGISWRTATSFDATQAFIKALSKNSSRTTVLERLEKVNLNSSETSGYPLQFTEDRERKGESILVQIKDGKFTIIPNK